jgi:uncharacterized protein
MTGSRLMKQQILFVHGGHAADTYEEYLASLQNTPLRDVFTEPQLKWSQNLRTLLGDGFEVAAPLMPNKYNADYTEWKIWFGRYLEACQDEVTLVGHSLGGIFLAKYLAENRSPRTIIALHLVAAVASYDGRRVSGLTSFSFDLAALSGVSLQVGDIHLYHSTDDQVVPYDYVLVFQTAWPSAQLHTFTDRGHFLQADFPELVASIKAFS